MGKKPEGYQIRHLNGNKNINNLWNLKYGTRSENAQDAVKHGCHGENAGQSKLTEVKVKQIRRLLQNGVLTQTEIAKKFRVAQAQISRIKHGKTWVSKNGN